MKLYLRRQHRFSFEVVSMVGVRDYSVSMDQDYPANRNPSDTDFAIRFDEEQPLPRREQQT